MAPATAQKRAVNLGLAFAPAGLLSRAMQGPEALFLRSMAGSG